jgi:signal peptidase I
MRSLLRLIVWTVIVVGCIIGLARATAIRWWRIPVDDPWLGASVEPTLRAGDLVILWRLTRPSDGELVKCPEPNAPERIVVGRVIGVADDKIEFDKGVLKRNGAELHTERTCPDFEVTHPRTNEIVGQTCRFEDREGRLYMRSGLATVGQPPPSSKSVTVDKGQWFLVSDNRQFPFDSRDYGTVEAASCKEAVVFRIWGRDGFFNENRRFQVVR